jgi:hypothetical protein
MLPMPWVPFFAMVEGKEEFLKKASPMLIVGMLLLSPIILAWAAGQWVSLLLCWRPIFPKIIREAGEPGKPIPKLTTAEDYPPDICERIKKNKHRWRVLPGSKPASKKAESKKAENKKELTDKSEAAAEMKKKDIGNERSEFGVGFKIEEK